jgi:hypothetical protein
MVTGTETENTTGVITQQKTTSRRYVKLAQVDDGQGNLTTVIKTSSVVSESDKKEPDKIKDASGAEVPNPYAGLPVSWANAERDGLVLFSENDAISYSVKSFEGAEILNPDPAMRLYIYNKGLAVFQTSLVQAYMKSLKEGTTEPEAEYNGTTLDLRVGIDDEGTYSINKAPSSRRLTDEDKLVKLLKATGKTDAQIAMILVVINASQAAEQQATGSEAGAEQESEQEVS